MDSLRCLFRNEDLSVAARSGNRLGLRIYWSSALSPYSVVKGARVVVFNFKGVEKLSAGAVLGVVLAPMSLWLDAQARDGAETVACVVGSNPSGGESGRMYQRVWTSARISFGSWDTAVSSVWG
ncbi:hypothetical protein L1887_07027 [Cichorium endivia]|nr:hypothetical protein L1887_07027 [Cichorium endivia]